MRIRFLCILVINFFVASKSQALEVSLGIGELYSQATVEDLANSTTAQFAGFGFMGELRFRAGGSYSGSGMGTSFLAKPEVFFYGGSGGQNNTQQSTGSYRKNNFSGAGIDFSFPYLFVGGQVQSNSSSVETTTATTTDSYSSMGIRIGTRVNFSTTSPYSFMFLVYQNIGRGVSASSTTGSSYNTETGGIVVFQGRIFRTAK